MSRQVLDLPLASDWASMIPTLQWEQTNKGLYILLAWPSSMFLGAQPSSWIC